MPRGWLRQACWRSGTRLGPPAQPWTPQRLGPISFQVVRRAPLLIYTYYASLRNVGYSIALLPPQSPWTQDGSFICRRQDTVHLQWFCRWEFPPHYWLPREPELVPRVRARRGPRAALWAQRPPPRFLPSRAPGPPAASPSALGDGTQTQ